MLYYTRKHITLSSANHSFHPRNCSYSINLVPTYISYCHYVVKPRVNINGFNTSTDWLTSTLVCTFFIPIGLFIFREYLFPTWIVMLRNVRRLVCARVELLDRYSLRSRHPVDRLLYHHLVVLPTPAFHISSIRCLAFRYKRLCQRFFCCELCCFCWAHVWKCRDCEGLYTSSWLGYTGGNLYALLLWSKFEGKIEVCSKVISAMPQTNNRADMILVIP